MAVGIQTSYDFSTGVKINMDELIYMYTPMDLPLLTGVGSDGNTVLSSLPVDETKFSWMNEEALLPRSTLGGIAATTDVFITVAAGERTRFSTGDMIVVHKNGADERMRVTGYGTTTDTLTVTRGYTGTATNYASGADVVALGTALAEGSDPEDARSVDRTEQYNFTQIYGPSKVSITRSEQGRSKYGVSDELAHQTMLRVKEASIAREQSFIYGARYESTTTKIRTSGGIDYFLTTNVDSTNTQLTVAHISTNLLACYDAGGMPDAIWCNPRAVADLNASNDGTVQTRNIDTQRGNVRTEFVVTEYGDIAITRNRWIDPKDAFGVTREGITRRVFDPMIMEKMAKTGDYENWMFVCEEGLQVKGEAHMFKMNNLGY